MSELKKICSKLCSCFTYPSNNPSKKYLIQSQRRNESPVTCQICPKEEKDPRVYNFINYIGKLPDEMYTYFLKQHLEENK